MSIKVKTADGKKEISMTITKRATVENVKREVEKQLHVKKDLQRLFFSGKQLEDGYHLHSYNINYNDVILLMIKTEVDNTENKITSDNKESTKEEKGSEEEEEGEELEKAESLYYKIGDAVDCIAENTGAWHEAIIKNIYKKRDELFYKISWEFSDVNSPDIVSEIHVRPRARRSIPFDELSVGQKVMINYNIDEPKKIGLWFDFTISQIEKIKRLRELVGQLHISSDNELGIRKKVKEEIYAIEAPKLLTERTEEDERFMMSNGKGRPVAPDCEDCGDNPDMQCQSCGCKVCAGKEEENTLLICDECEYMFHMKCLNPPLLELPQEPDWYCPECKNDENEIVKAGDKLKETKKKPLRDSKRRNYWGAGMTCAGKQKNCTMVPENHCGPIPGVDVGTTWKYRIQGKVSEAGVHRPPVAGIHGREKDCAYSIVLSGGYEGDYDNGDEFLYSGSGGRDLSGNKRTNVQSKDQELTKTNLALAKNCNARVNIKDGAAATDSNWKEGKPVRVIRNYKLKSKYAPEEGNRYDGIYKVIKYYPDTSACGYLMWKYVLRRDDPTPAPWTEEGKARIAFLGLKMLYPDGHPDTMKKLIETGAEKPSAIDEDDNVAIKKSEKLKRVFDLEDELKSLIENDKINAKLWTDCKATLINGKPAFLDCVSERFKCVCCLGILYDPVTTPCGHNICLKCLKRSFASEIYFCPSCRYSLGKTYDMAINQTLSSALLLIYPGYKGEQ